MTLLDNFSDHLTNIINDHKNLIILGNLNVNYENKEDLDKQNFMISWTLLDEKQWINCIIHEAGLTLDSIIMQIKGDLDASEPDQGWKLSDQWLIKTSLEENEFKYEKRG